MRMRKEKESGMEKLIELLNEYDPYIASDGEHNPNLWGYAYQGHSAVFPKELAESYIISARYGFIKWLVDNDKIDFEGKLNTLRFESLVDQTLDSYLALLMLLAIQDEPIEFLCSLLK